MKRIMAPARRGPANKLRTALLIWLDGACQAMAIHRAIVYTVYDPVIGKQVAQCCLINGAVFLGCMGAARLLQGSALPSAGSPVGAVHDGGGAHQALWLLPAICVSFAVNAYWGNSIAKRMLALQARRKRSILSSDSAAEAHGSTDDDGYAVLPPQSATVAAGDQMYRLLLCVVYLLQTCFASRLPVVGGIVGWLMKSWLFAFYCFDVKWSLLAVPLSVRIQFFERHWAFFGGYGSLCASLTALLPLSFSAAAIAVMLPVLIMLACGDISPVDRVIRVSERYGGSPPGSLRVFWATDTLCATLLRRAGDCLPLLRLLGFR